jgi:hypothetical protein
VPVAADNAAFLHDRRTALPVNGAIDATTAKQSGIRSVDDGIDALFRDVATNERHACPACPVLFHSMCCEVNAS